MAEKFTYDKSYFEGIKHAVEQIKRSSNTELVIIRDLLSLLNTHDFSSYNHSLIVAHIATNLAVEAGLNEEEIHHIYKGALLHDIGKLFVPRVLLQRKNGDYISDEQMELLRSHGRMGKELIHSFKKVDGSQRFPEVYEFIADQHNKGIGKVNPTQEELSRRHYLVPYVSVADFVASALDEGKKSLRTFAYDEAVEVMNRKFEKGFLPMEIRNPFNSLMRSIGPLLYDTSVSAGNLYPGKN